MTLLKKFNQAPFELKAFAVFAILTILLSYVLPATLAKDTWEKTIKYTGWSPATTYMFSLILVFSSIFQNNYSKHIYLKWILVVQLSIQIYSGFQRQLLVDDRSTTINPYLMVSEYQYIWTILIPVFWILVILLSPNIKRFYEVKSQESIS
jgi:hypothetical protein